MHEDKENSIRDLLSELPADECDYDTWLRIGIVIFNEIGEPDLWYEWSEKDDERFDQAVCESKWESFDSERESKLTLGSLVYMVKQHLDGETETYGGVK